jgi:hypothetical protein
MFNLLPGSGSIDHPPELIQTQHRQVFPFVPFAKSPHRLARRKRNFLPFIPIAAKHKEHSQGVVPHFDNPAKQRLLHLVGRKTRFGGLFYKVDQLSDFIQPFPSVESGLSQPWTL